MSLKAYFEAEDKALDKHEFHDGNITTMAGASFNHDNLAGKVITAINIFIEEKELNYFVNGSDTKIRIESYDKIVYPDAVVICEKPEFFENRKDTITNPLIVVEILSKSTEAHDRSLKFEYYRTLPSFKEYVLIHQEEKRMSVYTQQADDTWIVRDYVGEDAVATLHALHECPLVLKKLYRGLETVNYQPQPFKNAL
ncbi:MAG: Uma2 family endonuclease [Haliscomenobacter sp.]|nr:Uma2 family endonuclease [Haliscomenobacter sp.]